MVTHRLKFRCLTGKYAVCRLPAKSSVPPWASRGDGFSSITRADDELSIVCLIENLPDEHRQEIQWTCFKLEGPFSFSAVGVLHSFITPLAQAEIPIFALSTYDTDYVLVRDVDAERATEALQRAGHHLIS
ncbi:MAG TPA: ACT domain-containing protein [Terriglobales bacterium]|nr:ACT domain-containing protein [Terriglobales bacterium]